MKKKLNSIKYFLKRLSKLLEIDIQLLKFDQKLSELGCWDSLTVVSTIALIDEYFSVAISGNDINNCRTISDLVNLIQSKIDGKKI